MALETELRFFRQHRDELLQRHEGKFALVKGEVLVGVFLTFDEAYAQGVTYFGQQLFLVRLITRKGSIVRIPTRYG